MALASSASASLVNYYDLKMAPVTPSLMWSADRTVLSPTRACRSGQAGYAWADSTMGYRTNNISGDTPGSLTAIDYITCPNSVAASDAVTIAMWIMVPDVNLPEGNPKNWYMRPVWKQDDTGTKGLSWGIRRESRTATPCLCWFPGC